MKIFHLILFVTLNCLNLNAQITDAKIVDSIFIQIKGIRGEFTKFNQAQDEIKKLKEQRLLDSTLIAVKEGKNKSLLEELVNLKKENDELLVFKNRLTTEVQKGKDQMSSMLNKQIEFLLKEDLYYRKLLFSRNMLTSIKQDAGILGVAKVGQLNTFIDIYDSILLVEKVFEKEYNKMAIEESKRSIERLKIQLKKNIPSNKNLELALEDLLLDLNEYCENTNILYSLFAKMYPLGSVQMPNNSKATNPFYKELQQAYYYVYRYPYLVDLLNKYMDNPSFREQYKSKAKLDCL